MKSFSSECAPLKLVFGESFEASLPDTAAARGMQDLISIQNIKNGGNVRHCDFELYTCDPQNNPDFSFTEVCDIRSIVS